MDRREGKHKNTLRLGGTGTGRYSDPGRSCKAAIHNLPEVRSSRYVSVKGFGADGLGCGAKSSLLFQMLPLSLVLIEAMIMYNTHTLLKVRECVRVPAEQNNCFKRRINNFFLYAYDPVVNKVTLAIFLNKIDRLLQNMST